MNLAQGLLDLGQLVPLPELQGLTPKKVIVVPGKLVNVVV